MKNKQEVWNRKVDPKNYPGFCHKKVPPVTWEDLGNRFHTTALRQFHLDEDGYLDNYKEEIKLFTETYDFGDFLWLHYRFIFAKNFKEVVQYIKEKGLYVFDIWGYAPTILQLGFPEYKTNLTPNGDAHQYLLQALGSKFLGWDNGEQDGRFFYHYAPLFCPSPQDRREAYAGFSKYFYHLAGDMSNYLVVLLGMYFAHYMAHFGNHRLLGAETAQALPSVPPWYAFIRGAGKQYGILWFGNASIFNRGGYRKYRKTNKKDITLGNSGPSGPDKGTSLELLKRLWYVEYMYGSCMMSYEQGHIFDVSCEEYLTALAEGTKDLTEFPEKPALTPIGELQVDCTKWCREHPDIGVQYTPVALLMDFYNGWAPPRSAYHPLHEGNYLVWGNMYYEKGDHQVDAFFRLVYPSYEDCSYYENERGYLTPTPAGDIFDVLLSNAPEGILYQYSLIILLGEIRLEGKLLDKIRRFLEGGGKVIVFLNQLSEEARKEFDLKTTGSIKESKTSRLNKELFPEKLFRYEAVSVPGADILASSKKGDPLILKKKYKKGEVIIITGDFGLNKEENAEPLPNANTYTNDFRDLEFPLPPKYYLSEYVKTFLIDYLKKLNPVEVKGTPVQYITNVTTDSKKMYVTISNNENSPWEGSIRIKGEDNIEIEDLFNNTAVASRAGEFKVTVKPLDIGIYCIQTKDSVVTFKKPLKEKEGASCKIAVWSRADAKGSIWQNVDIIGRSSFTAVELCVTQLLVMDDRELSLLSEQLRAGNIDISALSLVHAQTPYVDNNNLTSPLPWTIAENRKFLSRCLKIAEVLECKKIILSTGRIHPGGGQSLGEAFSSTIGAISTFGREAGELGMSVLIEPAPLRVFGKTEELIKLLDGINLPNVGIALDTGHTYFFDENAADSLKRMGARVKYINLNSPSYRPGLGLLDKHLRPGNDLFDRNTLRLFLKELKKINYKGILCFNSFFPEPVMENIQEEFMRLKSILGDGSYL